MLGGDRLVAMALVGRERAAGLRIGARQVFTARPARRGGRTGRERARAGRTSGRPRGLLRHLPPSAGPVLAAVPAPQIEVDPRPVRLRAAAAVRTRWGGAAEVALGRPSTGRPRCCPGDAVDDLARTWFRALTALVRAVAG